MKDRCLKMDHITLGVCYYPEHWPEDDVAGGLAGNEAVRH